MCLHPNRDPNTSQNSSFDTWSANLWPGCDDITTSFNEFILMQLKNNSLNHDVITSGSEVSLNWMCKPSTFVALLIGSILPGTLIKVTEWLLSGQRLIQKRSKLKPWLWYHGASLLLLRCLISNQLCKLTHIIGCEKPYKVLFTVKLQNWWLYFNIEASMCFTLTSKLRC